MLERIKKLFFRKRVFKPGPPEPPRLILAQSSVTALRSCMKPEIRKKHESIAYLLGQTNSTTTLVVSVIRPQAQTTPGSFKVESVAMIRIMRAAVRLGLQVVGQIHTHPRKAFHSEGDEEGARIAYSGYASIVLPDYGRRLPSFKGAVAYMFQTNSGFIPIAPDCFVIVPGKTS